MQLVDCPDGAARGSTDRCRNNKNDKISFEGNTNLVPSFHPIHKGCQEEDGGDLSIHPSTDRSSWHQKQIKLTAMDPKWKFTGVNFLQLQLRFFLMTLVWHQSLLSANQKLCLYWVQTRKEEQWLHMQAWCLTTLWWSEACKVYSVNSLTLSLQL